MGNSSRTIFQALGDGGWKLITDTLAIISFLEELPRAFIEAVKHPRKIKWRDTFYYMDTCGSDALPIVSLLGFLVGIILAFQAVVQLQRFGVGNFVVNLVSVTIVRELGPLMVAIVVAGRSGSAFASEIATMKVSEELDAMVTMGFTTSRFIIVPKVLALFLVMPLLTIFADIAGVAGGITIAYWRVGVSINEAYNATLDAVDPIGLTQGLVKSLIFALLISCIGCMRGLQAKKDAKGVGRASTSAVVSGIFLIIIADALITALFSLK